MTENVEHSLEVRGVGSSNPAMESSWERWLDERHSSELHATHLTGVPKSFRPDNSLVPPSSRWGMGRTGCSKSKCFRHEIFN
jgi:hypothetical protein